MARPPAWSRDKTEAFIAAYPHTSNPDLAVQFGVSRQAISLRASRLGIRKDPSFRSEQMRQQSTGRVASPEQRAKISDAMKASWSRGERHRPNYPDGVKLCIKCNTSKRVEEFYFANKETGVRQSSCIPCHQIASVAWKKKNPDRERKIRKKHTLRKTYGLSIEEYEAILLVQGNVCAVCKRKPYGRGKALHVDHDHETGNVRGLLCTGCNSGLGRFQDDPEVLRQAAEYIERSRMLEESDSEAGRVTS